MNRFIGAVIISIIGFAAGAALYAVANLTRQHFYCGYAWKDCRPSLSSCEPVSKIQAEWDDLQERAAKQEKK